MNWSRPLYSDDRERRYFKDQEFEADYRWLETKFPGKEISVISGTRDERQWLISAHGDTEPGETYLFDRKTREPRVSVQDPRKIAARIARAHAGGPLPIVRRPGDSCVSDLAERAWRRKGLPALMVVHGGPWARDEWGYNRIGAVLRQSRLRRLHAQFSRLHRLRQEIPERRQRRVGRQDAGRHHLGRRSIWWSEGIADPKRIGILGGSYGGYAALAGVAFTPDLYRAAVDIVGPSNLMTLLASIPPYWEAGRKIMYARMADPETPAGKKWLEERSPLYSAAKIKTPLLVVQGANDPRVNRREAEQIVIALRDRGFPVEYLLAPDEGHGFARPVNNLAMFMAVEKFLAAHLKGRYQEGGSPEVVARLKEITVDPKTVVISKIVDASTRRRSRSDGGSQARHLQIRRQDLDGRSADGAQAFDHHHDGGSAWTAVENMDTPMGVMLGHGHSREEQPDA